MATIRELEAAFRAKGFSRREAEEKAADLIKTRKEKIAMSRQKALEQIELLEESRDRLSASAQAKRGFMNGTEKEVYDEIEGKIRQLKMEMPNEPLSRPGSHLTSGPRAVGGGSSGPFRSIGEQYRAIRAAGIPGGPVDPRLHEIRAASGLNETVPSDGSFLLQQDFSNDLLTGAQDEGKLLRLCKRYTISSNSNSLKLNAFDETSRASTRFGGTVGYWTPEAGEKLASKPKFRQINLELDKLIVLTYSTDELLEDVSVLSQVIRDTFVSEIAFRTDLAILNGSGVGQPLGVLQSGAVIAVAKQSGQAQDTLVAENIFDMWARLLPGSESRAVWVANKNIAPQLYTMAISTGTGGIPVYQPANQMAGSPFQTLMGRPIIWMEQSPTLGDQGDILLADFSGYVVAEKGGVKFDSSISVRFVYDESVFRAVYRIAGSPVLAAPVTPYLGTTQSHFVTLAERA
jgi:HK97 family phage major capsid protein